MIQVQTKILPKSELLITIVVSAEKMATYEEQAAKRVSENVEIPGFRKGQAPKAFIISHLGPDAFFQEVMNIALPRSYFEAVQENKLEVISRPEIKVTSRDPFTYEAKVATMPEVKVKGIENLKITSKPAEISEMELEEVVSEMRRYRATYKPLTRPIQKGDRLEIDFQGYDEGGAPLDNTKSANHPIFVGEGTLVPGFEDALLGMNLGEKKRFPVTFPKDYHYEPMRKKVVHFETEIKKAEEVVLPELNDDFVSEVMGSRKTVTEFKEALKNDLAARKKVDARRQQENELLEKLVKDAKLEVPPILIEEEIDYMMEDLKREVESRGLNFDTYLKKLAENKKDVRKESAEDAEKRIRIRLILNHLFRELKITVTDEDVAKAGERFLETVPDNERTQMQQQFNAKGEVFLRLKNNLMLEALFARFLDS